MQRPSNYSTKHGKAVLSYLAEVKDRFVTAAQIADQLQSEQTGISRPTVYRQLERLVRQGRVHKYTFDGAQGACFQYAEPQEEEQDFCHLKCEVCGDISVLKCDEVDYVSQHIFETHAFRINGSKIVFYGNCKTCLKHPEDRAV